MSCPPGSDVHECYVPLVVLSDSVCRVQVIAEGLPGGDISLKGSVSSQYLTAILMASPLALGDINITISDTLVSVPYVDMTIQLMQRFGVKVGLSPPWPCMTPHS
jgi:5-enolpyruvylshikimate-3-phosphate synthase